MSLVKAPRRSIATHLYAPISLAGLASFDDDIHERARHHPDPIVAEWIQEVPAHGWLVARKRPLSKRNIQRAPRNRGKRTSLFKNPVYKMKWQA